MCEILNVHTCVKCDWCACRYGCFLFAIMCKNVCISADLHNFACSHTWQMCGMCMQVLQPEFVWKNGKNVCKSMCVQVLQLEFVYNCVQKCGCANVCTSAHVWHVCNARAGISTRLCLQKIVEMCAKVWMCENFQHPHTCKMGSMCGCEQVQVGATKHSHTPCYITICTL